MMFLFKCKWVKINWRALWGGRHYNLIACHPKNLIRRVKDIHSSQTVLVVESGVQLYSNGTGWELTLVIKSLLTSCICWQKHLCFLTMCLLPTVCVGMGTAALKKELCYFSDPKNMSCKICPLEIEERPVLITLPKDNLFYCISFLILF